MQFEQELDPEIESRIAQYEMAFRMQTSVPEVTDLSQRAGGDVRAVRPGQPQARHVRRELPARAAAGRARRAVHSALPSGLGPPRRICPTAIRNQCQETDQASAALVKDLKQRGLLDDTLVIWGGEFGRTSLLPGQADRRRLRPRSPSALLHHLAGGRRHQAGHHLRPDRRLRLQHRRRGRRTRSRRPRRRSRPARSTSTICRRRSCTCWASITRSSPTSIRAGNIRLTDVHGHVVQDLLA